MLRLLGEVLSSGICTDPGPLMRAVDALASRVPPPGKACMRTPSEYPAASWQVQVLPLLAAFAKAGREELLCLPVRHPYRSAAVQQAYPIAAVVIIDFVQVMDAVIVALDCTKGVVHIYLIFIFVTSHCPALQEWAGKINMKYEYEQAGLPHGQ